MAILFLQYFQGHTSTFLVNLGRNSDCPLEIGARIWKPWFLFPGPPVVHCLLGKSPKAIFSQVAYECGCSTLVTSRLLLSTLFLLHFQLEAFDFALSKNSGISEDVYLICFASIQRPMTTFDIVFTRDLSEPIHVYNVVS